MIKKMVRGAVTEPLHRPKPTQSLVTLTSLPQSLSTSLKNPLNRVSLVSLTLSNLKTKMETEIKENKLGSPLAISQRFKVSKDAQRSNGESSRMAFECSELEFSLFDDGFRKVNIRLGFNSGIPQACRRITKQSSDDCIISSSSNCNGTNIHVKNRTNANIRMSFHKGGVQLLEL
ncbi:uncharacterized protein LOC127107056 isoform X3 [Lathyrus oleraceus]|uniref:uncharacterized protein LOC127107056 isoform X3 n=1 Tax=Pisum sativum TaxID=3888 RepID=UPI0021D1A88B|nr:uncharacterized protein LOC127107056 isoform X3 [Pisum sativum]